MRSAQLLILAYKAHKKGLSKIAQRIFTAAMKEESAPNLMEVLFKQVKAQDNLKEFQDLEMEEQEDEIDVVELEDEEDFEAQKDEDTDEIDMLDLEEQEDDIEVETAPEAEIDVIEVDDDEEEEVSLSSVLTKKQIAQLKAIANQLASKKNPKLAKELLAKILK